MAVMSTAIFDRLTITLDEVKAYLHVDGSAEDTVLTLFVNAAKRAADNYCQNFFTANDLPTGTALNIPDDVKTWVLQRVGRSYERRSEGLSVEQASGVGSLTWGECDYDGLSAYKLAFRI